LQAPYASPPIPCPFDLCLKESRNINTSLTGSGDLSASLLCSIYLAVKSLVLRSTGFGQGCIDVVFEFDVVEDALVVRKLVVRLEFIWVYEIVAIRRNGRRGGQ
jgi:hypothetical protein